MRQLRAVVSLSLALCAGVAAAQSILAVAGGGTDDGRPATQASLSGPMGVATAPNGDLYITDWGHARIRKVAAATGIITTVAGNGSAGAGGDGGPATQAALSSPMGNVAIDASGNFYIGVFGVGGRVRRVDAKSGVITTFAGGGTGGDGGPATAAKLGGNVASVAIGPTGDVYFVDASTNRVRKVSASTGIITTVAGSGTAGFSGDGGPATAAALTLFTTLINFLPPGIAIDSTGALYISDVGNNRVRKVDTSGTITTIAGNGSAGFGGDGGPGTAAALNNPSGIALDGSGNLLICDSRNARIRKMALGSGTITTIAGGSTKPGFNDGGPASGANFYLPLAVALNSAGDIFIADADASRIRRIAAGNSIITTYAGTGVEFAGDGPVATMAGINGPMGLALDSDGALIIAESGGHRIRRLGVDGTISTIAGTGSAGDGGDGGPATKAGLLGPAGVAVDLAGNVHHADTIVHRIRRISASSGIITTIAGTGTAGFSGDGGPATAATINLNNPNQGFPLPGIVVDANGDLYFSDVFNCRIRKIAGSTQIITTIAGTGTKGFSGDGGPATAAQFDAPFDLVLDRNLLYVADNGNRRIRRIDLITGTITTVAGGGTPSGGPNGDGGPPTAARLQRPNGIALDGSSNLFIADDGIVRKISGGTITTIAGTPGGLNLGFAGDNGPATAAGLSSAFDVAVDKKGNVYIADMGANRIRAIFACVNVAAPSLTAPVDRAADLSTAVTLTWSPVDGAFRYDVYASTANPPAVLASDLTATTFTLSNLISGSTYYWKIVAKGDPFCTPASTASSEVRSFITATTCAAPSSVDLLQPADGASSVALSTQLSWQAASGAGTYDVFFGPSNPPALLASGITTTSQSVSGLGNNTTYYWSVTAHASCDVSKARSSSVRSFKTAGACAGAGSFVLIAPSGGASGVALTTTLQWSASSNATSYDVYLGTTNPPSVYLVDVQRTLVGVSGLAPGKRYYWKVLAKVACDATKNVSSAVATFTTGVVCPSPRSPSITFVPPGNVGVGQTYTIAWQEMPELDETSYYIVERSSTQSFASVLDSQQTSSTTASFVANSAGTYYHRVLAMRSCDLSNPGPSSDVKAVVVVTGTANVIFTVQPEAVVTSLGDKLEDRKALFTMENIGASSVQVVIGKGEINSVPFFTIADPSGGDSVFTMLAPRTPKTFEIHYSGPVNDQAGAYQGLVFLASTGQGLAITPYVFVNLKVGGGTTSQPVFVSKGFQTEYAFFPGYSGDDGGRGQISIDIRNNGSSPMELGAEIGPEVWLVPQSGWNSTPIAAGTSRTVQLRTARSRAPNGSALPRYTYFTVRSKSGETARLLVQDNDAWLTAAGRTSLLDPGSRSYIVPGITSTTYNGAPVMSRLRMTNIGSEAVQADLFFTPAGSDGFDTAAVKRATVVIPPNDAVTLTDPLVQVFGLTPPAQGQIEMRAAPERIGFLLVAASVVTSVSTGGSQTYQLPTLRLGEGARVGSPHSLAGVTSSSSVRSLLVLAETSGTEATGTQVALYDGQGSKLGESTATVARYGVSTIDLASITGGASVNGGRIEITPQSGGGSVTGTLLMLDATQNSGSTAVSQPVASAASSTAIVALQKRMVSLGTSATALAPVVFNGPSTAGSPTSYRTSMGFTTSGASASAVVTYRPNDPAEPSISRTVPLVPNVVLHLDNVLEQLFGIAPGAKARGSVYIGADAGAQIYARLATSVSGGPWRMSSSLPLFPSVAEVMTSLSSRRPLYLDGLEQSTDGTRGTGWAVMIGETSGNAGSVTVRLYEAGNRSLPIAEKTLALRGWEQITLDTVFAALGLETDERRKDRINVLCVVTPESGRAVLAAVGVSTDNATGNTNNLVFSPTGGVPATGVVRLSIVTPVTPSAAPPRRRRAVSP